MIGQLEELPDDKEYKLWLVWKLVDDKPFLVAIDTSEEKAHKHEKYIKMEAKMLDKVEPETFVEESKANHLYGQSISDLASFKIAKLTQNWK